MYVSIEWHTHLSISAPAMGVQPDVTLDIPKLYTLNPKSWNINSNP